MGTDSNTHWSTVGPTASAADTETEIGGADITLPSNGPIVIDRVYFQGLNEVDAKASSGKAELKISGVNGPFKFTIFQGQGASSSAGAHLEDEWKCHIPVAAGARVGIYTTMCEAWSFIIAGIEWHYGSGGRITYSDIFGPTDGTAVTRTRLGGTTYSVTLNPGNFTITELRLSIQGVEEDKFEGGQVELVVPGVTDETFPGGSGGTAATIGCTVPCSKFKIRIGVSGNTQIQVYFTPQETTVDNIASITYE